MITPPTYPKVGDLVEVYNPQSGYYDKAIISEVIDDRILGNMFYGQESFSYTINSYRENWKYL